MESVLAHVGPDGEHLLVEHLQKVGQISASLASKFNSGGWGELAGVWHDLGKFRPGFQRYIRESRDNNAHIEGRVAGRDKTHSAAGALWAIQSLEKKFGAKGALAGRVFAYLIASHHAGLYDWDGGLAPRLAGDDSKTELAEALAANPPEEVLALGEFNPSLSGIPGGAAGFALWVRMLFSCLVDADFLDTEAFFDVDKSATRACFPSIAEMRLACEDHLADLVARAVPTKVNALRAEILQACETAAEMSPGFFSLTVPTGGGKTLSSLAFALHHADLHAKRRVIYAIPYTSIIEQTADVFREVFKGLGSEVVVEHHSQAESEEREETAAARLACENWDAPLVVTTNVQLFESLFAARTSRCRKLHNLVDSVIVLDEAQQLPAQFLQPVLDALNLLVKHYRVSVVLCTATQPALSTVEYFDATRNLRGLDNVREIVPDAVMLHTQLKRVQVSLPASWQTRTSWEEVADQLSREPCVLAIVSSRRIARELHQMMPAGTLHLSAQMCGAHRADVIRSIKARLKARAEGLDVEPLRVVSTQLVEAGVDIDFPVVWRALAGLDSIAQAAGRCNREGRLPHGGRLVVFVPPEAPPPGWLRKAADACVSTLHGASEDPLSPHLFERYFRKLYYNTDLDAHQICAKLAVDTATLGVEFRSAAEAFKLIEDEDRATVVVRYGQSQGIDMLIATLLRDGPQRWLMRKLQRYMIDIPRRTADALVGRGLVLASPGLYIQQAESLYRDNVGFVTDEAPFNPAANVF